MSAVEHEPSDQEVTTTALEPRLWSFPWQEPFLVAYSRMGNVSAAARAVGIGRKRAYDLRWADPDFALAWEEAKNVAADLLEQVAWRRATTGEPRELRRSTTKKVNGAVVEETEVVEQSVQISNALLITLLKGLRPEVYRERFEHRHTGADGGPIKVEVYREPTRERMLEIVQLARELELPVVDGRLLPANGEVSAALLEDALAEDVEGDGGGAAAIEDEGLDGV